MSPFTTKKPWVEKREKPQAIQFVTVPDNWQPRMGNGKMLIATPKLIDELIRKIPEGYLTTIPMLRQKLALDHDADVTCPLTTGIFLRIDAEAAEEEIHQGKTDVAPYWRVVREDGGLIEKFPGGVVHQANLLDGEGHMIIAGKGRSNMKVADFDKHLFHWS